MNARDRQDAMLGWMRLRRGVTVEQLAGRFGVSVRTAHRDIAALRERGVPVRGDPGPGGGLRVDPLKTLPAVRMELEEVVGLVLAVSLARRASNLPFGGAAQRAVDKVLSTLPEDRAAALRQVVRRVVVGHPASAAVIASLAPTEPGVLDAFEAAFAARRSLAFGYVDRRGVVSQRHVEPHGLLIQPPVWYLLAHDLDREAPRMFRLDRVQRPALGSYAFRPRPLDVFRVLLDEAVGAEALL